MDNSGRINAGARSVVFVGFHPTPRKELSPLTQCGRCAPALRLLSSF